MTLQQLIDKFNEYNIPPNWELTMELPGKYFNLKGILIIDQREVGLVFEDHQRIVALNEDPEEYCVPIAN